MGLADKQLKDIGQADLESLKQNGIPESREIEYKQSLDLDAPEGKRKFLKQVSSFANSAGGYLLFGIREDKGIPIEISGLELADQDQTIQRIDNLVRDGLAPRLGGFAVRAVPLTNGNYVLVMQIQKSWFGPHLVRDDGRFYYRHSSGASPMDATELRNAFLQSGSLTEQIKKYRLERLAIIDAGRSPLGSTPKPKVVVQIIPTASYSPGFQINWEMIARDQVIILPFGRKGGNTGRLNLDGHVIMSQDRENRVDNSYLQWFRNGILESGDVSFLEGDKIYGTLFAGYLIDLVKSYLKNMESLNIPFPIVVFASLIGVRGFGLVDKNNWRSRESVDRDDLLIPEVLIDGRVDDLGRSLMPIFEALWNAAGLRAPVDF